MTLQEMQQKVDEKSNSRSKFLVVEVIPHKKETDRVKILHTECGSYEELRIYNFCKRTINCSKCDKKKGSQPKKTQEQFVQEVRSNSSNYEVISDYVSSMMKVSFKHISCGTIFQMRPDCFLSLGQRCPKCGGTSKLEFSEIKEKVENSYNSEYELLSTDYINNKTKLNFRHKNCGNEFLMSYNNFDSMGNRCPHCFGNQKKTQEEFALEVSNSYLGEEYEVIGQYTNSTTNISFLHKRCNNVFNMRPVNFITHAQRCPKCMNLALSRLANKTCKYLDFKNLVYFTEFKDSRCVNKRKLPFDIAIPLKDFTFILIELDGAGHFKPSFGKTESARLESFVRCVKNDEIKNLFVKNNSPEYSLFRINYMQEKNIEREIEKILNNFEGLFSYKKENKKKN